MSGTAVDLDQPPPFGHTFDAEGLPTVHEVPQYKTSYDLANHSELGSFSMRPPAVSRDASINSSMGRSYVEKDMAASAEPPPVPYTRHLRSPSDAPSTKLRKADRRSTVASQYDCPSGMEKQRRGGLRNTIRRMFTRKASKDRTSMPTRPAYRQHDPQEFMTSATELEMNSKPKTERSASLPTNAFLRSSGLSSHPPFQPPVQQQQEEPPIPLTVERPAPERPQRPCRASTPSAGFNKEEMQAVTDAMSGIGLPIAQEQLVEAREVGFAVTNGSHPKRRSRSAGACRESDHRMSPIQWRHQRTKSDEINYSRQSAEARFFGKTFDPESVEERRSGDIEENQRAENVEDFNFELQENGIQGQERIGVEERLVTLEIKLMDLEYALSRLQVGSTSSSRRNSRHEPRGQGSMESYRSSEAPSMPASPVLSQHVLRFSANQYAPENIIIRQKDRPTSVATTLKPGHTPQHASFSKTQAEFENRSSLSGLTIEHYSTLVTLLRNEQSARIRLEEQVGQLQQKLDNIQPDFHPYHQNPRSNHAHTLSNQSRRLGTINADGRRGGKYYVARPRNSSYSTNGTDTEDDYHDAYVTPSNITPVERGEYEGGNFERIPGMEDGEAF